MEDTSNEPLICFLCNKPIPSELQRNVLTFQEGVKPIHIACFHEIWVPANR